MAKKKKGLAPLIVCISLLLLVIACACVIYFGFISDESEKDRTTEEETSRNASEEDSYAESAEDSESEEDSTAESAEDSDSEESSSAESTEDSDSEEDSSAESAEDSDSEKNSSAESAEDSDSEEDSYAESTEEDSSSECEETEEDNDTESSIEIEIIPDMEGNEYIGTWNAVSGCDHDSLVVKSDFSCLVDGKTEGWVYQSDKFIITNYEYGDNVVCTNVNNGFLTIVREGFQIEGTMEYPMEFEVYAKPSALLGARYIDERLIGVWEGGFNTHYESYAFSADGTGFHNPDLYNIFGGSVNTPITWYVKDGTLLITENGQTEAIGYAFGYYLYLDTFIKFYEKKEAPVVTSPYVGTWMNARVSALEKLTVYENGICDLHYYDHTAQASWYVYNDTFYIESYEFTDNIFSTAVYNDAVLLMDGYDGNFVFVRANCLGSLTGDIDAGLVGTWKGASDGLNYHVYTFNSDGTGVHELRKTIWSAEGTITEATSEDISWFVNGSVLTIKKGNGNVYDDIYYVYDFYDTYFYCTDNTNVQLKFSKE